MEKACDIWSLGVITYILLCGYPPFYSINGGILSSEMKRKIKVGEYQFDGAEWKNVSEEAKSTIRQMLTVDPAQRISIDEILNCSWFTEPASETPIDTSTIRDADNWNHMQVSHNYDPSFIQI
jgi:mitogen-activated protein kinase-activated protein kinase 2